VQRQLNGERIIFSTNGAGKCTSICNKMNLDTPDTLLKNSKWIIELNVKLFKKKDTVRNLQNSEAKNS